MKKSIVLLIIVLFVVSGCNKIAKYEKIMRDYGKDYYEKYMIKNDDIDEYIVSIEMLEAVNNDSKYDLTKLDKCKKTSSISIVVSNGEIKEYKFSLNCD